MATKGYELIRDVPAARNEWAAMLDKPFDAERLAEIKARYDRGLRMDAVYTRLYEAEHTLFVAEIGAKRAAIERDLEPLGKRALAERLGIQTDNNNYAKIKRSALIREIAWQMTPEDFGMESFNARLGRIWAGLSQRQREGLDPISAPEMAETTPALSHG